MNEKSKPEGNPAVHRLANGLRRAATLLVVSCVLGLGAGSALTFKFVREHSGLLAPKSTMWEIGVAAGVGMLLGLGISLPFFILFRLQAALAEVDVRTEEHAIEAKAQAAETARSIQEIAEAGMSGEWRISGLKAATDDIGPERED
jgi:hypothetical protein